MSFSQKADGINKIYKMVYPVLVLFILFILSVCRFRKKADGINKIYKMV
jgi:hypothetical protein